MLAVIRPDSWDFPLFVHVLGASVLVGGLVFAVAAQVLDWTRRDTGGVRFGRLGFWALVFVVVPGWIVMRIGAQWIYSREGWTGDNDPSWLGVGFLTGDLGGVVLLVTIGLAAVGTRPAGRGTGGVLARVASVLTGIVLIGYLVAVWAMTAKPS